MTLEEAIEQVERTYKQNRSGYLYALKRGETKYAERCKKSMDEYGQLAEWLRELQERRKQPEIIRCKDCKHFERDHLSNVNGFPIITCHNICTKWGDGCATREDGFCFLGERKDMQSKNRGGA